MVALVLDRDDLKALSPGARAEVFSLLGVHGNDLPAEGSDLDPEADVAFPLTVKEAKELVRGLSKQSRDMLKVFCQNFDGEAGWATLDSLLAVTDLAETQQLRKSLPGITRRLRTVAKDPEAWIFDWRDEDWEWDQEKSAYRKGAYFIPAPAIVSLRHAFGMSNGETSS